MVHTIDRQANTSSNCHGAMAISSAPFSRTAKSQHQTAETYQDPRVLMDGGTCPAPGS